MPIESWRVPKAAAKLPRRILAHLTSPLLSPSPGRFPTCDSLGPFPITNDRAAPEGQRRCAARALPPAVALRYGSSVVIPRSADRPVSHGLKRSVEVLIRVSDRVPRPLITEPDLIRCPRPSLSLPCAPLSHERRARSRNRDSGGGGGGFNPRAILNFSRRARLRHTSNERETTFGTFSGTFAEHRRRPALFRSVLSTTTEVAKLPRLAPRY